MNVRSLPNKTPTCAFSRFPVAPKGHPSAVDIPRLCYLFSLPPAEKPLSAANKTLLTTASHLILERLQGPQGCTFNMSWQKVLKARKISSNLLENSRTTALFAAPASGVWKHWKPPPGVKRAELVWSLFIYPSFNLNSMFEMRPAMLLSAVVLWLKWEKPIYLFLSLRQWPFFCVQMLQCVDNIPVGFGGGLSQYWWHFDPPLPVLNSPLESPFACSAALLRNLCVVPQTAAAALESLILSPSHRRNPLLFFLCVLIDWGDGN